MTSAAADAAISTTGRDMMSSTTASRRRLGPFDVIVLSAWCGLAGGLLEVAARLVAKHIPPRRLYSMNRHFIWMAPLSSLLLFAAMGLFLALATRFWPRRGRWLVARFLCFMVILPVPLVIGPQIAPWASAILVAGISSCLVPFLERRATTAWRWLLRGFPAFLGGVMALAALLFGGDRLEEWREASRPLPGGDPPNVLLVVLDTVRADHLSVYGYRRPTSPALERLAERAIRFDEARRQPPGPSPPTRVCSRAAGRTSSGWTGMPRRRRSRRWPSTSAPGGL